MAEITASMVKELREATGLRRMMDCKKALAETDGDFKAAEELLRIKRGAKASKAASRVAAEGVVGIYISADGKTGAMVEVNCETDFVAKNDDFLAFAKNVAQPVAEKIRQMWLRCSTCRSATATRWRKCARRWCGSSAKHVSVRRFTALCDD